MTDLIKQLSELDNKRIENYMRTYVTPEYCGNATYLQYWSKNKRKLYHALGNQLILKIPYEYTKSADIIGDLASKQFYTSDFLMTLKQYLYNRYTKDYEYNDNDGFIGHYLFFYEYDKQISQAYSIDAFKAGRISKSINMLPWKQDIKPLKIPVGTKPMRALRKIVEYLDCPSGQLMEYFESYHQQFSQITNDKNIKGNLCFSIHPMDFLTLSDNNSGWKSCFNIREDGGYKCSTAEAMNSNNLICCYLENNNFNFSFPNGEYHDSKDWEWNNKRWRVLITLTKDICMVGKAYPFQNEEISKDILKILRPIIAANIGWEYKYGPERYMDMKHINYQWHIEYNQYWISKKATKKKNIIINTKGMYNDMLAPNSHKIAWCLRNPVSRNKVVSISGPCKCAECGSEDVVKQNPEWEIGYDEEESHYLGQSALLCFECRTASHIKEVKIQN